MTPTPPTPTPDDVEAAARLAKMHGAHHCYKQEQAILAALAQAREAGRREAGEDTARLITAANEVCNEARNPEYSLLIWGRLQSRLTILNKALDAARTAMEGGGDGG